ncbi:Putative ABC1 protein [Picochlorum sp. SENEW3]|nr:Putative ABC1 protein [Picochlorum sp. SENEW3]
MTTVFFGRLVLPRLRQFCFYGGCAVAISSSTSMMVTLQDDATDERGRLPLPSVSTLVFRMPVRLGRDAYCAGSILMDYMWSLRGLDGTSEAYGQEMEACHARGAQRLLQLCFSHGGIYIKLGQHVAMLDHLVPDAYVRTMRQNLLDRCPVSSWASVERTIREDFGCPWNELFEELDPIPVASASLAQVHMARDRTTGEKLAVKVQHEDVREMSAVDLAAIEGLVKFVAWIAPDADFTWLVREAHENLPRELDFRIEAENAFACRDMLESSDALRGRVVIPDVDALRTSPRVLTMEWIDGVTIGDAGGLKDISCHPKGLARLIATCFSEMIYRFGFVHADPHVANMLVRSTTSPHGWQLVLLDHGLYRRLDDEFRIEYSKLWKSLILGDVGGITESATNMNAADSVPLFAGMLTQRQWRDVTKWEKGSSRLGYERTEREKEEIQEYVGQHAQEIGSLLGKVPRELLLLLKTNDCLRAVDKELGAGYNTFVVTARECVKAINRHREQMHHASFKSRVGSWRDRLHLEMRLQAMHAYAYVMSLS